MIILMIFSVRFCVCVRARYNDFLFQVETFNKQSYSDLLIVVSFHVIENLTLYRKLCCAKFNTRSADRAEKKRVLMKSHVAHAEKSNWMRN